MRTDTLNKIKDFIKAEGQPVSALDIAQHILYMTNATAESANRIVSGLLKENPQFLQVNENMWTIGQALPAEEPLVFICCKLFPEHSTFSGLHSIHLAKFVEKDFQSGTFYTFQANSVFDIANSVNEWIGDEALVFDGFGNQLTNFYRLMAHTFEYDSERPIFSLLRIAKKLFPDILISSPVELSRVLSEVFHDENADAQFSSFQIQILRTMDLLHQIDIHSLSSMHAFLTAEEKSIDFSRYAIDERMLKEMTTAPGVYVMKNEQQQIIYIGKAKNLKRRVQSYFSLATPVDEKLTTIREQFYTLDLIETGSELEALLKEYELIQHYDPPINRQYAVHLRPQYLRERYARILFLPAVDEQTVQVLLFHPDGGFQLVSVAKVVGCGSDLKDPVKQIFFDQLNSGLAAHVEIVASWLSRHADSVSSIDMRTVTNVNEAIRLIELHVLNFDPQHKQVFH